jgi:preprotein translocase subunit SecG
MENVILIIHLIIALALIGLIMMQRSEGGALGIGGGGPGAGNLFSSRGVGNALTRATAFLAVAFFVTSMTLTWMATRKGGSAFDGVTPTTQQEKKPPAEGDSVLPNLGGAPKPAAPAVPTGQ